LKKFINLISLQDATVQKNGKKIVILSMKLKMFVRGIIMIRKNKRKKHRQNIGKTWEIVFLLVANAQKVMKSRKTKMRVFGLTV
jgi:uncharacterized membrane protein YozB (DUF420 family)